MHASRPPLVFLRLRAPATQVSRIPIPNLIAYCLDLDLDLSILKLVFLDLDLESVFMGASLVPVAIAAWCGAARH